MTATKEYNLLIFLFLSCNLLLLQKASLQETSNGCWLTSKKVSHHYVIYNTEYTINYIYMQWLDYHTHGKKIHYFYVHFFKDLHFYIQFIELKKILCTNLMCTEFVNPYSYRCTTIQIHLKITLQSLSFFFFFTLHIQYGTHILIPLFLKCELQRKENVIMQTYF